MIRRYQLLSALIGLSRAAEGRELLSSTGEAMLDGLSLSASEEDLPEEAIHSMISRLYAEKMLVSPDCAACQSPCGRTADYNIDELQQAPKPLQEAKLELLSLLGSIAADYKAARHSLSTPAAGLQISEAELYSTLSECLFLVGCTYEVGQLAPALEKAKQLRRQQAKK